MSVSGLILWLVLVSYPHLSPSACWLCVVTFQNFFLCLLHGGICFLTVESIWSMFCSTKFCMSIEHGENPLPARGVTCWWQLWSSLAHVAGSLSMLPSCVFHRSETLRVFAKAMLAFVTNPRGIFWWFREDLAGALSSIGELTGSMSCLVLTWWPSEMPSQNNWERGKRAD